MRNAMLSVLYLLAEIFISKRAFATPLRAIAAISMKANAAPRQYAYGGDMARSAVVYIAESHLIVRSQNFHFALTCSSMQKRFEQSQ